MGLRDSFGSSWIIYVYGVILYIYENFKDEKSFRKM